MSNIKPALEQPGSTSFRCKQAVAKNRRRVMRATHATSIPVLMTRQRAATFIAGAR